MLSHAAEHFATVPSVCELLFGGITAVMMLSTTVQSFVAVGSMPRPFERRLDVGVLRRRFRRTSLGLTYFF